MSTVPTALITAGSAGLGAATATLFARAGFNVAVNFASNQSRAAALCESLSSVSPLPRDQQKFHPVRADLADKSQLPALVADAVALLGGRLDVVFSNGGWTRVRDISDLDDNLDEEDWDRCFTMNVKSHLFLMKAAREHLEESEGAFITTASLAGVKVSGSSMAYSVTKAAQIHLVKALAIAAGPRIRVNSVSPGLLLTDWGMQFSPEQREATLQKTRLKRLPTVDDVAEQVLVFAKSRTVTGANAVIDGGMSL
ncbi:3-oxoacyl-[acyl-carrier-protein] reductase FabG [Colletotrichum spinosum]|uniref:3-oxoacyl-[acyl-carrier-protein] reductase FabG n=1 Tax=Colletotrichum spinosum TaxID=1347390 RepID=A0A4R8PUD6_9PEZI|nr:3-oxoacyl-[acyl-carrier-protein] reductase FabG [Colletotrichum spinosum]